MTVGDRLGHRLLARGWHGCAVGAWLSGGVRLTASGLSGRGRLAVSAAARAPGPRYPVASREAARQPIAPASAVVDRPAIVTTASRWSVVMRTVSMSGLRYGPAVDLRSRRADTRRVVGTCVARRLADLRAYAGKRLREGRAASPRWPSCACRRWTAHRGRDHCSPGVARAMVGRLRPMPAEGRQQAAGGQRAALARCLDPEENDSAVPGLDIDRMIQPDDMQ